MVILWITIPSLLYNLINYEISAFISTIIHNMYLCSTAKDLSIM